MLRLLTCILQLLNVEGRTIHFSSASVNKDKVCRKMRNTHVHSWSSLRNKSTTRNPLMSEMKQKKGYDVKKHCIWVDRYNFGVTHFRKDLTLLSWNDIHWDVFYFIKNMTVLLISVVYKSFYDITGNHQFQNDVQTIMNTYRNKYPIDVLIKNRNFHSLNENICHLWTINLPKIGQSLQEIQVNGR